MTNDELDEVRRLLLAFEDAASWCEQLAELARPAATTPTTDETAHRASQITRVLQHLEADRQSVGRVRTRLGIPPLQPDRSLP